jgi:hypothetical protein
MKSPLITLLTLVIAMLAQPALADVEGTWDLSLKPKLKLSVYGQSVPVKGLPALPTSDQVVFTAGDQDSTSGSFVSNLFAGEWKQSGETLKGSLRSSFVISAMDQYLSKGSFEGFTFSNGKRIGVKSRVSGKELADGTIKGTITEISKWSVQVTKPKKMKVIFLVTLTAPYKGVPAGEAE